VRWLVVLSLAPGLTGCGLAVAALVVGVGVAFHEVQKKNGKALFVVRNPDPDVPILALAFRASPEDEPLETGVMVPPGGRARLVDVDWTGPDGFYDVLATWADGREGILSRVLCDAGGGPPAPLDFAVPPRR
jgi:hypothetical protein